MNYFILSLHQEINKWDYLRTIVFNAKSELNFVVVVVAAAVVVAQIFWIKLRMRLILRSPWVLYLVLAASSMQKIRKKTMTKKNNRASNNNDTNGSLTSFIVCPIFCILSSNQNHLGIYCIIFFKKKDHLYVKR